MALGIFVVFFFLGVPAAPFAAPKGRGESRSMLRLYKGAAVGLFVAAPSFHFGASTAIPHAGYGARRAKGAARIDYECLMCEFVIRHSSFVILLFYRVGCEGRICFLRFFAGRFGTFARARGFLLSVRR